MSFILYLVAGLLSGVLGGMGMGGGTIMIPSLTIFLGVGQKVAQATNVIAFLPMAAIALPTHKKNGLLKTEGTLFVIIPALVAAVLSGVLMAALPQDFLKKLFGMFLVSLALKELLALPKTIKSLI